MRHLKAFLGAGAFCVLFCIVSAQKAPAFAKNRLISVTGVITYYGNAPFAEPAFKADDGTVYALRVSEDAPFTLKDVLLLQGHRLQLDGIVEKNNAALSVSSVVFVVFAYKDRTAPSAQY